jgi:hypothetical protein
VRILLTTAVAVASASLAYGAPPPQSYAAARVEFAVIENVLSDSDSPKARCFINSYRGLQTKVPPYVPFVLQMSML